MKYNTHTLDPAIVAEYQERSIRLKFKGQFYSALTGATFLGALGAIGSTLIRLAPAVGAGGEALAGGGMWASMTAAVAAINWPVALVFLGVGLAAAYLSTSYYQKAQMLDADFNARKIAAATQVAPALAPEAAQAPGLNHMPAPPMAKPLAPVVNALQAPAEAALPTTHINAAHWQDKGVAAPAAGQQAGIAAA